MPSRACACAEHRRRRPPAPAHTALRWRHVLIGLAESYEQYVERGYTPQRAIVAVAQRHPGRELAAFRALQFGWFTTTLLLDEPAAIAVALARVDGIDPEEIVAAIDAPEVLQAYEAGRLEARSAAGGPTQAQGKAAATDGPVRFTAPSLTFTTSDGSRLEAGGFQPLEAYDVCIMNLDPTLERRGAPADVVDLLAWCPDGLTTREVAQVLAPENMAPEDRDAEERLIASRRRRARGTRAAGQRRALASGLIHRSAPGRRGGMGRLRGAMTWGDQWEGPTAVHPGDRWVVMRWASRRRTRWLVRR